MEENFHSHEAIYIDFLDQPSMASTVPTPMRGIRSTPHLILTSRHKEINNT